MSNPMLTGISALRAFQTQLSTTSHNIANADTEGYSRQVVGLATRPPNVSPAGYVGTGVEVTGVTRQYDKFLTDQLRSHTASNAEYEVYFQRASQVDNLLGDVDSGLSTAMQDFFNSLQDVADDPSSIPARQVMLAASNTLADRFHSIDDSLADSRRQINRDFTLFVDEVNQLSQGIADLNTQIQASVGTTPNTQPNDLLDKRDQLVTELSQKVNVSTIEQADGALNVFIGNGQSLVVGSTAQMLVAQTNAAEADRMDIALQGPSGNAIITSFITGGELGGMLRFRSEVLDPAQNAMGRIAVGLATSFNNQHVLGMDLDGNLGVNYFSVTNPEILGNPANAGSATVAITDITQLDTTDYELSTADGTNWNLLRRDTGAVAATASLAGGGNIVVDGITITIAAGAAAGDSYVVRPTRAAGAGFDVSVSNARQIAAASPISVITGASNSGTGSVNDAGLSARTGSTLPAPPVSLTFNAATNQFNISTGGTVAYNPATDSGNTLSFAIAGLGTVSFEMRGVPANGDAFSFGDNSGAVGDNRNARKLADLQVNKVMVNGTASFADTYGQAVANTGSSTRQAQINSDTQERLLAQATEERDALSGVNLDEEAANLVHFQQAYQAAAQVIRVANTLFDSLLNAVGR